MTSDDDHGQAPEQPWHHSTPAVLGASVAALTVIALVVWGVVTLTSGGNPEEAPIDFVDPTHSSTSSASSTTTTTATITSTRPPLTTEFGLPSETSGSATSSTSETSTSSSSSTPPTTTTDSSDETTTTRKRPRTNVTRTLYPAPGN